MCLPEHSISAVRVPGSYARVPSTFNTVDFDPFIKSQLASTQLTLGPYVVQIWSRTPRISGGTNPSYSTVRSSQGAAERTADALSRNPS